MVRTKLGLEVGSSKSFVNARTSSHGRYTETKSGSEGNGSYVRT